MRHASALLRNVTAITGLLFVLLALAFPGWNTLIAPWIVLSAVFLIGIPHGAIDHVMASELFGLHTTLKDYLFFYGGYLILMLLVGALWYFLPVGGMILFLSMSIYHFGQADMEDFLRVDGGGLLTAPVWHVVRGLLIIGLILFSNTEVTYPILAEAMRIPEARLDSILPAAAYGIAVATGPYVLATVAGMAGRQIARPWYFLMDSLLLVLVLMVAGPLTGFALYFALWHSAGHIREMQRFFRSRGRRLTLPAFYWKAAPFTLVSLAGLALLAGINRAFGLEEQFLSLMFILISVLTLPHMVIVDRMYRETRA